MGRELTFYLILQLLCRLLNVVLQQEYKLPNVEELLNWEIVWLKNVKVSGKYLYFVFHFQSSKQRCNVTFVLFTKQDNVKRTGHLLVDDILLEGHLGITKELFRFMSPEKRYYYGSDESANINLAKVGFQLRCSKF